MRRAAPGSLAAFRHHNFRLYWSAQLISLMGTFMQLVALGYLVYALTGSKWLLGTISAVQMAPSLLLSLPAGVLADRVPRRRLIMATQSTALLLAFSLATLTALHRLEVWEIIVISTVSGVAIAMESPARQAFVAELVGPADLPNAIGWNSLVINGSRVVGPAVGGIAIRFVGEAPIFYYNSFSFLAMIVALLFMRVPASHLQGRHPWRDLREGLSYTRRTTSILMILALTAVVASFVMNFAVLMPIIARDVVHTGAAGLGWMWTFFGLGAVAGSMTVVTWSRAAIGGPLLVWSALVAGLSTVALAGAATLPAVLVILVVVGWSTGAFFASANSAVQDRVTNALRGRVLSLYTMIFSGSGPVGGLLVAGLSSVGGAPLALAVTGGITVAVSAAMAPVFVRSLRGVVSTASEAAEP
jgi:MFS family permease